MQKVIGRVRSQIYLIYERWLVGRLWRLLRWVLDKKWLWVVLVLVGASVLFWQCWAWISRNSGALIAVGTIFTGIALVVVTVSQFMLSRKLAEFRYSPMLGLYPLTHPQKGKIRVEKAEYKGVKWRICAINPGEVPIWVRAVSVRLKHERLEKPRQGPFVFTHFCKIVDAKSREYRKGFLVRPHDEKTIEVFLCPISNGEKAHRKIKVGQRGLLRVALGQEGRLGKPYKSGFVISSELKVPYDFSRRNIFAQTTID